MLLAEVWPSQSIELADESIYGIVDKLAHLADGTSNLIAYTYDRNTEKVWLRTSRLVPGLFAQALCRISQTRGIESSSRVVTVRTGLTKPVRMAAVDFPP